MDNQIPAPPPEEQLFNSSQIPPPPSEEQLYSNPSTMQQAGNAASTAFDLADAVSSPVGALKLAGLALPSNLQRLTNAIKGQPNQPAIDMSSLVANHPYGTLQAGLAGGAGMLAPGLLAGTLAQGAIGAGANALEQKGTTGTVNPGKVEQAGAMAGATNLGLGVLAKGVGALLAPILSRTTNLSPEMVTAAINDPEVLSGKYGTPQSMKQTIQGVQDSIGETYSALGKKVSAVKQQLGVDTSAANILQRGAQGATDNINPQAASQAVMTLKQQFQQLTRDSGNPVAAKNYLATAMSFQPKLGKLLWGDSGANLDPALEGVLKDEYAQLGKTVKQVASGLYGDLGSQLADANNAFHTMSDARDILSRFENAPLPKAQAMLQKMLVKPNDPASQILHDGLQTVEGLSGRPIMPGLVKEYAAALFHQPTSSISTFGKWAIADAFLHNPQAALSSPATGLLSGAYALAHSPLAVGQLIRGAQTVGPTLQGLSSQAATGLQQ